MINEKTFNQCIITIITLKDIEINNKKSKLLYNLMKNDFTDEQFQNACNHITKLETLYNKYPSPEMFYKYKIESSIKQLESQEQIDLQSFLSRCKDYLKSSFLDSYDKKEFNKSLTERDKIALRLCGGISELWSSMRKDGYQRNITSIHTKGI